MGNLIKTERKALGLQSIFDELFNNESLNVPQPSTRNTVPAVNIRENENGFFLEFAMPGITKDQVVIELDNDKLTVSSKEEENKEEKTGNYTRKEFYFKSFKRSFMLPETIDASNINANHKDGVLSIEIPKKEEAKPKPVRQIEIGK